MNNSLYEQFGTDNTLENEGVFVCFGDVEDNDPEFKISRMGKSNKKYQKALEKAAAPHKRAIAMDLMNPVKAAKLEKDVFAEAIVLDWRNVKDRDGNEMIFNKKNVLKLLHDLPDLYEELKAHAQTASLFRQKEMEDEAKN